MQVIFSWRSGCQEGGRLGRRVGGTL